MHKIRKTSQKSTSVDADNWQLYILCIVPMLLVFVFCYLPIIGIVIAFKNYKYNAGILGSKWVGLKNFELFFKSDSFISVIRNTLGLNAWFIILSTACALIVAILLFEVSKRAYVKFYQTILIVPNFISWVMVSYMVFALLSPEYGMMNSLLVKCGGKAIDWYSKPGAWPAILSIANVWKNVGMDSVVYYAALMGISSEMLEAADLDGTTHFQKMWYVILPSLRQIIVMLTILKIGNIFRADFGLFYQVTRNVGTLYPTTDVMDTYIYRTMSGTGGMSISAAAGLLQSVVGFVCVIITNCITKKIDPDSALF